MLFLHYQILSSTIMHPHIIKTFPKKASGAALYKRIKEENGELIPKSN